VGLEVYRTGRQRLEDDPFRMESEAYTIIGLLAERRIGRVRAFVNLENLTDVRQSDYSPLLRPSPTRSAWANPAAARIPASPALAAIKAIFFFFVMDDLLFVFG